MFALTPKFASAILRLLPMFLAHVPMPVATPPGRQPLTVQAVGASASSARVRGPVAAKSKQEGSAIKKSAIRMNRNDHETIIQHRLMRRPGGTRLHTLLFTNMSAHGSSLEVGGRNSIFPLIGEGSDVKAVAWPVVWINAVLMFVIITPVWCMSGSQQFGMVFVYIVSSTLVNFSVKAAFQNEHQFPFALTVIHLLLIGITASWLDPPSMHECLHVLPVSLLIGASLVSLNAALAHGNVAFVTMICCGSSAVSSASLNLLVQGRSFSLAWCRAFFFGCAGIAACVLGTDRLSIAVLVLALMAKILWSLACGLQHYMFEASITSCRLIAWGGIWSSLVLTPMALQFEGFVAFEKILMYPSASASAVAETLLCITQCYVPRQMPHGVQRAVASLHLLVIVSLASAWFKERVTNVQWSGIVLLLLGMVLSPAPGISLCDPALVKCLAPGPPPLFPRRRVPRFRGSFPHPKGHGGPPDLRAEPKSGPIVLNIRELLSERAAIWAGERQTVQFPRASSHYV